MNVLLSNIIKPLVDRLGSMAGVALASQGVASDDINVITAGLVALAGITVDLVVRKLF